MNRPDIKYFIYEDNSIFIGYIKIRYELDHLIIDKLYIHSNYTGKGIGTILLNHILKNNILDVYLYVWECNLNAIRFYEKMGFVKHSISDYPLNGINYIDIIMKKTINT